MQFGKVPLLQPELLKSIGSDIHQDFLQKISSPFCLPSAYIHVVSPLDVHFRSNSTHPPGFLWAIERSVHIAKVTHHVNRRKTEVTPCEPFATYGFLAAHVTLNEREDILEHVAEFRKASSLPKKKLPPDLQSAYRERVDLAEVEVLTEFDSRNRYFAASIPLEKQPWDNAQSRRRIQQAFKELQSANDAQKLN